MATVARAALTHAERRARLHGVYAILSEGERDPFEVATAALDAGVRVLQYRAKAGIVANRLRELRALTRARDALLIVNDDANAAAEYDCDGVHLGPEDEGFADPLAMRRLLQDRLIGLSCGTIEEAHAAEVAGADYLGVGSVYATGSKADAGAPIGVDGLRRICAASALPVAAVGGITADRIREVRSAGAAMVAVISALAEPPDVPAAAADLVRAWDRSA